MALLLTAVMTHAQEWTVIELPANASEMNQLIKDRFGCDYTELPTKYNLTHLKFIGTDFKHGDWSYDGQLAVQSLVAKAKVIDMSEVKDNAASIEWFEQNYYDYPGPERLVSFLPSMKYLEHIIYPKTLTRIPTPLNDCPQLTQVTWPDKVVELAIYMFDGCSSLKQITIPSDVIHLPNACFMDCRSLTSVSLPAGLKSMDSNTFNGCSELATILLPEGVETMGSSCFASCKKLLAITLPSSLTEIGTSTFYHCDTLKSITLPKKLKSVPENTFMNCANLQQVNLPDCITSIGSNAFCECKALREITLPMSVTQIGDRAFYSSALESLTMPDAVTTVGDGTFENCVSLRRMHLSRGISSIPTCCFKDCPLLEEVNIPQRVAHIGREAFANCYMLTSPQLPAALTQIGEAAFHSTRFDHVTLPAALRVIGAESFCLSQLKSIDVPASVIEIGAGAFAYCDSLSHATLHEGLLYLNDEAFRDDTLLQDVALPSSLRVLGKGVFYNNKSKKSFVLPPLINVVPDHVCSWCDGLTSITLHDRTTAIDANAFEGCKQLTSIDLPYGLQTIGGWAFRECPLRQITIPPSVRIIQERAFDQGDYSRVVLPEGVETVWARAFCSKRLRHVDFPSTIAQLGDWAFQGDGEACDSIIMRAALPPNNHGYLYHKWHGGALYVPAASVDAYKHDEGFDESFATIKPLTGYATNIVVVATTVSTDSTWLPVIEDANLTITHAPDWGDNFDTGHLHVGSSVSWPVNHLRYDYQLPWEGWDSQQSSTTLINEGTMTAQSMEMNLSYYPDQWLFFTPPFDMKASDLTCINPRTPFVLRTFNGAQRAAGNHGSVWGDVSADSTLYTGRGYILQYGFYRQQTGINEWKSFDDNVVFNLMARQPLNTMALSAGPVTIPLAEYKGEFPHNEGWNLVANPFMAYFDISQMDSDAPIIVSTRRPYTTFDVFSPIYDNLALRPLQAFFVQRSPEQSAITFSPTGRQTTIAVDHESENSTRSLRRARLRRQSAVYNAKLLCQTEHGDSLLARTRVVVTPRATENYDCGHDAPFMTMDDAHTALYSRTNGLRYSLNELPPSTESVQIGMHLVDAGTYTLCISVSGETHSPLQHLWLKDKETGSETDLLGSSYTFTVAEPCTLNNRFVLQLGDGITVIDPIEQPTKQVERLYDLQGRPVDQPAHGIYLRGGKKVIK